MRAIPQQAGLSGLPHPMETTPMTRKINKARKIAIIGNCGRSFAAMLACIPNNIILDITSRQLADLLDANWRLANASKAIANHDAISEGAVWDHQNSRFCELAPTG